MNANQQSVMTKTQRREQRLQALFDSCEQQMLQQLIGPFGLTPAMFEDKTGGNVTTVHNFKQGITATADDQSKFEQLQDKKIQILIAKITTKICPKSERNCSKKTAI